MNTENRKKQTQETNNGTTQNNQNKHTNTANNKQTKHMNKWENKTKHTEQATNQ